MKTLDQTSSLFWLLVSISVLVESTRLGIGTLHDPGMGFLSFGASGIMGILSLVLFFRATLKKKPDKTEALFAGPFWKRVIFVLILLVIWARVMPELGYLISTFLLMGFLYWVLERKKIWLVLLASVLTTLSTYVVFSKWLNCQFPEGVFGF
jgi:putative tricarboxylic transport membrane protein